MAKPIRNIAIRRPKKDECELVINGEVYRLTFQQLRLLAFQSVEIITEWPP